MPTAVYSFQAAGVVLVGTNSIANITKATVESSHEREYSDTTVAGDTVESELEGIDPIYKPKITLEVYDETGTAGDFKGLRLNDASTKNQTLKIRPQGTGTGLPELIIPGCNLVDKNMDMPAGKASPPVSGKLTWETRISAAEPAWTAQA
jgi:hypothetical protein